MTGGAEREKSFASGQTLLISGRGSVVQFTILKFATRMQLAKQLALFLENRPGTLARLADALGKAKINIYAITTSDTVDHSVVRIVVSDYRRALHLFED